MGLTQKESRATLKGKISVVTTTGLLKGELENAKRRTIPVEAWIGDSCIGATTVTCTLGSNDRNGEKNQFEMSLNMQEVPTAWLISPEEPIKLRRPGRIKPINRKGWFPGRKEAEAFLKYGLRRLLVSGRIRELPEMASRHDQPGLLRDAILESLGMAMATFMATGDRTIDECVSVALECREMADGLNSLVIERNAYLCTVFTTLTESPMAPRWASTMLGRLEDLLKRERVKECLLESMPTTHLHCERKLWSGKIELAIGAVSYRLFESLVGFPRVESKVAPINVSEECQNNADAVEMLSTLGEYIYNWHSRSNLGFLFYELTGLLAPLDADERVPSARETEEIKRYCESYCYEQAALQAIRHCRQGQAEVQTVDNEELGSALETIQLALSGYDFASGFQAFSAVCRRQLSTCWDKTGKSHQRKALQNELFQYSRRVRALASSLGHTHCPINDARDFEAGCLRELEELTGLLYAREKHECGTRKRGAPTRWLIVGSRELPQCWIYRVKQKKEYLESLGHQVRILGNNTAWSENTLWTKHVLWADVIIVCRAPYTFPIARLYGLARSLGRIILYEIDDVIFSRGAFPPPLETYGHTISDTAHRSLAISTDLYHKCIQLSDGCIVSTHALKEQIVSENIKESESVFVLPNLMLPRLQEVSQKAPGLVRARTAKQAIRIVFASGTLAHKQCWNEELAPALADVMKKRKDVELVLLGSITLPSTLYPYKKRIIQVSFQDYSKYISHVLTGDIGLAVLEEGTATDCKSAIKWMEYSVCGLASVVSPSDTHRRLLDAGNTAFFARGTDEWKTRLNELIDSPTLRVRMAGMARQLAVEEFGNKKGIELYKDLVKWAWTCGGPTQPDRKQPTAKKRLLVVNVFFRPESHGGATRVAEQQAFAIANQFSERFEVTVLCQDPCLSPLDRLSILCHHINGVRIVRFALPHVAWGVHWEERVSRPLSRMLNDWYETERFDLLHAHCLQVLTVAPLIAAKSAGIPFIISLHDAWWLSPYQFLTTDDGTMVSPTDPTSHLGKRSSRTAMTHATARRSELKNILDSAAARLAVSTVFQKLYADCGLSDVGVLVNQHASMEGRLRHPSSNKKNAIIRACFIGGVSAHKGYYVLREAMRRSHISGLSLDIVDHRLNPGSNKTSSLLWGGTTVRFIPKVQMNRMADFYQHYDLLIAPSIWPESFGLVTREAISAGLWVIASDIGALSEVIMDGVNGYRIEPGNWKDLQSKIELSIQALRKEPRADEEEAPPEKHEYHLDAADGGSEEYRDYLELLLRYCKKGGSYAPDSRLEMEP